MPKSRSMLLTVAASLVVLVGLVTTAAAAGSFDDDDDSIHESAIEAIAADGITRGCNPPTNSLYCPDRSVTRAEMATFLVRAFDLPSGPSAGFGDTAASVHVGAIDALAAAGITKGCNPPANTRYCPGQPVTRAQMATFLTRALGLTDDGGGDRFRDDDGSVHEADIDRLGTAGITKGCNPPANTEFCPNQAVTRAEMATFLSRALGLALITPEPPVGPGEEGAALVARFHVSRIESDRTVPHWVRHMGYWPRSFAPGLDVNGVPGNENWQVDRVDDPGPYRGWDALSPANSWGFNEYGPDDDWMQFTLNRPARVAVVWRDDASRPDWLRSGWSAGGTVQIDGDYAPVYERDYPAGQVKLGTVEGSSGDSRTMYLVLVAEADGQPSPDPDTPGNRAVPTPGEACPSWVHDRHVTTGPDGKSYQTWHPQWDPVYWCSFGHEHGSNPALIPGAPLVPYGYVAARLGQDEPNMGFKEFIFEDLSSRHWVRFVVHAGTAMHRRVCAQFHTLYVQVYDDDGTELMNVGFKADYGDPVAVRDAGSLTPACARPGYDDERRVRLINVAGLEHDYERWRAMFNTTATRNLGFGDFHHAFDIRNPMSQCVDMACNSVEPIDNGDPSNENATRRTIDMSSWQDGFSFSVAQALATGEFHTDPYGLQLVSAGASNSVRQYIDPLVQSTDFLIDEGVNRIMCVTDDPWTMYYECIEMRDSTPFPHADDMQIMFSIRDN